MFTNALAIIQRIQADLAASIPTYLPGVTIYLDEPLDIIYTDLPVMVISPNKEEFIYDSESQNQDKKRLLVKILLFVKGGPSSSLCSPIMNYVVSALKADRTLGGLAMYVEFQGLEWLSGEDIDGRVSGASLEVMIDYFVS